MTEKDEHHVSILVSANARAVNDAIAKADDAHAVGEEIRNLTHALSWDYDLTSEYYLHEHLYTKEELQERGYTDLTEHTRRAIVQCVDLPDIEAFYTAIEGLLGISLFRPVPHITLYRWSDYGDYSGIGINSKQEFEAFTVQRL